ncbi:MAG: hypothetical protein K2X93_05245 [Candidatus Obscuribacterales bacterium]|nr:hypothetical protein [Candidatus Obscuribacterales bacterium]
METISSTNASNSYTPFRIKDLMLGEFLCQAGIVSDAQLIELTKLARAVRCSLGSAIVFSKILSPSELFLARRLLNRYLCDLEQPQQYIDELGGLLSHAKQAHKPASGLQSRRSGTNYSGLIRVS